MCLGNHNPFASLVSAGMVKVEHGSRWLSTNTATMFSSKGYFVYEWMETCREWRHRYMHNQVLVNMKFLDTQKGAGSTRQKAMDWGGEVKQPRMQTTQMADIHFPCRLAFSLHFSEYFRQSPFLEHCGLLVLCCLANSFWPGRDRYPSNNGNDTT